MLHLAFFFFCSNSYSPKHELTKPYHMHPCFPTSHLPRILAAKLSVVPNRQTSMSLTLMLSRSMFTGVRRVLNLQNRTSTTKLFRIPNTRIDPKITATTLCPVRDSFSAGVSLQSSSSAGSKSSSVPFEV